VRHRAPSHFNWTLLFISSLHVLVRTLLTQDRITISGFCERGDKRRSSV